MTRGRSRRIDMTLVRASSDLLRQIAVDEDLRDRLQRVPAEVLESFGIVAAIPGFVTLPRPDAVRQALTEQTPWNVCCGWIFR